MINFSEEIEKFKPALEIEQIEDVINTGETQDIMDVLMQISNMLKLKNRGAD